MPYYKSVHQSTIQLAYQILYGQIVNGLSEQEIREFTVLIMIHNKGLTKNKIMQNMRWNKADCMLHHE